jgi:hypothetical protein
MECASSESDLYLLINNGVVIKANIETGNILSTYDVYTADSLWDQAYIYERNTQKYEIQKMGVFRQLSQVRQITHNDKYNQLYISSNFKNQIISVVNQSTLQFIDKQPELIQTKCLEFGRPMILYPGSHDQSIAIDTIIPGFRGVYLHPSNDLIYVVVDSHKILAFNSADFSFRLLGEDSSYYLFQQPVYSQGGELFYTNCPYDDKDPDLCFAAIDAFTLKPSEYYRFKGGITNFYIYGGENYFYPYYDKNKILVLVSSTRNLGLYNLTADSLEDINIGAPSNDLIFLRTSRDGSLACGMSSSQKDKIYIFELMAKIAHQVDLKAYYDSARFVGSLGPNVTFSPDNKYLAVSLFMDFDPPVVDTLANFRLLPQNELLIIIDTKSLAITREIPLPYGGVIDMTF